VVLSRLFFIVFEPPRLVPNSCESSVPIALQSTPFLQ
jgi:hypothetical protein